MIESPRNRISVFCKVSVLLMFGLQPLFGLAQTNIERRVYYLDVTYSMVKPNNLWDAVRENLVDAIRDVDDINTELVVVTFEKDIVDVWERKADDEGKAFLISKIESMPLPSRSTMTNLYAPWKDFVERQAKAGRINYMFFMTDGEHEVGGDFLSLISKWTGSTNPMTYGFYVMLSPSAHNDDVSQKINAQKRLWIVNTANMNMNLIRLAPQATWNVRTEDFFDVPVYFSGSEGRVLDDISVESTNPHLKIRSYDVTEQRMRVHVSTDINAATYPEESYMNLKIQYQGNNDKTVLMSENVRVKCLNKKESKLTLDDSRIRGNVSHYSKFLWKEAATHPYKTILSYNYNEDAIGENAIAEFEIVDHEGKRVSSRDLQLKVDGQLVDGNRFSLPLGQEEVTLEFTFPDHVESGKYQGSFRLSNSTLDRIDNQELSGKQGYDALRWTIRYKHAMNPLTKDMLGVLIVLGVLALIWFAVIRNIKYPRFPRFRKTVLLQKNGKTVSQHHVVFTGARQVVFSNKKVKQSVLNRFFTGKIVSFVNPEFKTAIYFNPKRKSAIVKALGYRIDPNPVPRSGRATITNIADKFTIVLQ